jgi:hypothetical protein
LLNNANTKTRSYALAGTFGPSSGKLGASNATVLASGVNLRNIEVLGDLVIDKKVGDGDVRLEGVDVNGTLLAEGGGLNSIYMNGCKVAKLDVAKSACHVVADAGTTIENAIARGASSVIELKPGVTAGNLTIIGNDSRIVLGASTVIEALEVRGENAKIETQAGSVIKLLSVDAPTNVVGQGTIVTANVSSQLNAEKKPETVNITGTGKVVSEGAASTAYATPIPPSSGGSSSATATPVPDEVSVNTLEELDEAVAADVSVINLTEEFYDTDFEWPIWVGEDDAEYSNSLTIKGLGKASTKKLNVGISVMRKNVTLDGINIEIADADHAVRTVEDLGDGEENEFFSAISIGREGVKVLNSEISVNGTADKYGSKGSTAGIFAGTLIGCEINGNTIRVKGLERNAVAGVLIYEFSNYFVIYDNIISAEYGTEAEPGSLATYNAPAAAIHVYRSWDMSMDFDKQYAISNNSLSNDQYSFFIDVLGFYDTVSGSALHELGFGTQSTTWASTTPTSLIRTLFDDLKSNVASGSAFAGVKSEENVENYEIKDGKIKAISYTDGFFSGRISDDGDNEFKNSYPAANRSLKTRSVKPQNLRPRVARVYPKARPGLSS